MRNSDVVSSSWRKSSFSEAGNCVEVAGGGGLVLVRDTKLAAGGGMLSFPPLTWREFIDALNKI
jgi:Domain of unknown function (DUF397)